MKNNRSLGSGNISVELIKKGGKDIGSGSNTSWVLAPLHKKEECKEDIAPRDVQLGNVGRN